jgi:7-cyano-7-deazaguanine synthase
MKKVKTVLVYSGGMDSTTLLYKLLEEGREVRAISFNYGQKHSKELVFARKTCKKLGVKHKVVDISFLKELVSNSALTSDIEVPEGHYAGENMKITVVPNRNMIMASIAIGYAVNVGFDEVALGVHAGDHTIYPDCRPEFITHLDHVSRIANFKSIEIYTPFLDIDKGDIAIIGKKLKVDYSLAWTCYKGKNKPCGKCGACQERAEAFQKAKLKDPLIK